MLFFSPGTPLQFLFLEGVGKSLRHKKFWDESKSIGELGTNCGGLQRSKIWRRFAATSGSLDLLLLLACIQSHLRVKRIEKSNVGLK